MNVNPLTADCGVYLQTMKREDKYTSRLLGLMVATGFFIATSSATASVIAITGLSISPSDTVVDDTAVVTSFSTASETFTTGEFFGVDSASNVTTTPAIGGSDSGIRNYWGENTSEVDGAGSITGAYNLDLGYGIQNLTTMDVQFGTLLTANPGSGNDLFLFELGANSPLTLQPLNGGGSVIGDYSLSIGAGAWGSTAIGFSIYTELEGNTRIGPFDGGGGVIGGVAFDISDFTGTSGDLGTMTGLRISDSTDSASIGVVGYLTSTTVPEPSTCLLLVIGMAALGLCRHPKRTSGEGHSISL